MTSRDRNVGIRLSLKDGDRVRRDLMKLGKDGQRSLELIERGARPASKGLLAVNTVTKEVRSGMESFGMRLGVVGAGLMALGPGGLAAAAGVGAFVVALSTAIRRTRTAVDAMGQLNDQALKLGVGVEPLQELRYAFEQAGVPIATMEMGLQRLGRRMGNIARGESKEVAKAFDELGINVLRSDGTLKSIEEIMPEIADGMAEVTNQNTRLALAQKLFDSEGVAMVTLLQRGSDELRRFQTEARDMGLVMDRDLIAKGDQASARLETMQRVIDTQLNSALVDLAPVLVGVAEGFAGIAKWVAETVDGFREMDDMSLRGLEQRAAELDSYFDNNARRPQGGHARRVYDQNFEERERLQAQLMGRHAARAESAGGDLGAGGGTDLMADSIEKVTEALRFQLDQLGRTELGRKTFQELQRAGIDGNHAEAETIVTLVREVHQKEAALRLVEDAERSARDAEREGLSITRQTMTATEALAAEIEELSLLREQGAITAGTYGRAVEAAEQRALRASRVSSDGIRRALRDYGDEAADVAQTMEQSTLGALKSMEDAFVEMARTGKVSFSDMADAILADLVRIQVRQNITGPLASAFGDFDFFHDGGIVGRGGRSGRVDPRVFFGAPRFHGGGKLGRSEVPIIAERGERVLTEAQQDATARSLESMAMMAAKQPSVVVHQTIHNNAGEGVRARGQASWGQGGALSLEVFVEQIEDTMAANISRSEGIAPMLESTYGLNRAAGSVR